MSLEELRNETEEQEVVEESNEESTESSEEFQFEGEPEPDQPKYTVEETLTYKLNGERAKKLKLKSKLEELEEENKRLKAAQEQTIPVSLAEPAQPLPQVPDLWSPDINGDQAKYNQAMFKYQADVAAYNNQVQVKANRQAEEEEQAKQRALKLAERSGKFIKEHNIGEGAIDAIQSAVSSLDQATQKNGGGLFLLDKVGDGSEKLALYLGRNPQELNKIREWLNNDPTGLSAIAGMTRMAEKLTPKNRNVSNAPPPDEPLQGEGSSQTASNLQAEYDRVDSNNFDEIMKIRRKARELGIVLK